MDEPIAPAYRHAMQGLRRRSPAIALIAAYVLALQGLLAAFGPTVPVALASPLAALCSGETGGSPDHPAGHDRSCIVTCSVLTQGGVGPLPSHVAAPTPRPEAASAAVAIDAKVPAGRPCLGPYSPRAPPLV